MRRSHAVAAVLLAFGFACTPTEPCACPPARTHALVYGLVQTSVGAPGAGAVVRLRPLPDANCVASAQSLLSELTLVTVAADGRFRAGVYSLLPPDSRCIRVTAFAGVPGASDSSEAAAVVLAFQPEGEPADSAEVVLELP